MKTGVQWLKLMELYNSELSSIFEDLTLTLNEESTAVRLKEQFEGKVIFNHLRYLDGSHRVTSVDLIGLVGFTWCNFSKRSVILTEGISDMIAVKLIIPDSNVLGRTRPSFSVKLKELVSNLFDEFIILGDNDTTGRPIVNDIRSKLVGKRVKVAFPSPPYKDMAQEILDTPSEFIKDVINNLQA